MIYNLKIIKAGKRIEIYKINNYVLTRDSKKECSKLHIEEQIEQSMQDSIEQAEEIRQRVLNKARNNIIRLVNANEDMTTFITLTFKKETDYISSKKYLNNLFTKLRRDYKDLKYLWVLEFGDVNNRLHYHVLTNILVEIKLSGSKELKSEEHKKYEQDFSQKYWRHGFVDIRSLKQEDNSNIGLYISVYVTKNLAYKNLYSYRIYGYSKKTLIKPTEEISYTKKSLKEIVEDYAAEYKVKYSSRYEIGFEDYKHKKGIVNYLDLYKK